MLLLSPSPISLLCALLLCLPLAIIFTITSPITTTTTTATCPFITSSLQIPLLAEIKSTSTKTETQQQTINYYNITTTAEIIDYNDEDDNSLFRLAARVNSNPTGPRKLAFLFLTTTPLPFAPIWETYFNKTPKTLYNIYIHADPNSPYDPPFSGVFRNRVIPESKPTRRHTPNLISAARRLLSHALLHDPSNSKFALLSPSCVPLHSFKFTYRTLIRSRKSFIEILKNESGAWERWAARGEEAMLPELPFEDFRIGSQFFVLTRKHARMVAGDRRVWAKFKMPCLEEDTCYPEEQYFPTLLNMKDPRGCVHATLTHVDWTGRDDGHPRTYNASEVGPGLIVGFRRDRPRYGDEEDDDVTMMLMNGSDSSVRRRRHPFLFARKFTPDSVGPLLSIARDVIFKD